MTGPSVLTGTVFPEAIIYKQKQYLFIRLRYLQEYFLTGICQPHSLIDTALKHIVRIRLLYAPKRAHPMNIGDCLAWVRKRHPILAKPNDKSGMTLKPCTSARFQHNLKIRNILDTTKNSSASCVFIICLLK